MKPANLIRLWGLGIVATACLTLGACDDDSPDQLMTTDGSSDGSDTEGDTDSTSGGETESDSEEETTGPPPEGLGCGITPDCSRGTLDETVYQLSDEAQIEEIAGYTKLAGTLTIDNSDFECLDFLACLEEVGGDITVFGNQYLENLEGTNNIRNIGTEFCPDPSNQPQCVAGGIVISNNSALTDVNGFDGVLQATISLNIRRNDALTDISGLNSLVAIWQDLNIQDNPELTGITGMSGLKAVGGGFVVTQNPSLCVSDVNVIGNGLEQGPDEDRSSTMGNDDGC